MKIKYNSKRHGRLVGEITKRYDRYSIASYWIERFSARIYSLISKHDFDLLVFPGNSGLMMLGITQIVYEHLEKPIPKHIEIPVYRDGSTYSDTFDIDKANEILIIDDEIMTGTSARYCIEAVLRSVKNVSHVNVTIVAENMFFEWHHRIPGVSVYFYPYARAIPGLGNNISYIVKPKQFRKLIKYIPIHAERKQILALLLSSKIKLKDNNNNWYFDTTVEGKVVSRTPQYLEIKKSVQADIIGFVKSGIERYKEKDIKFIGE